VAIMAWIQGLEGFFERHEGWRLNKRELATDVFYVVLSYTAISWVSSHLAEEPLLSIKEALGISTPWMKELPFLAQALIILFLIEFGQYWMHRWMHNWYPLWLTHSVHHYITQLNVNKGAVGNPVELFLIGLGIGGFFDFLPRAALLAGAIGLAVGSYQHINVRFNSPRWWRYLFNTTEHHSLHHSQDFEASRSNYSGTWIFIDRMFGTCVDGEAELLGMEGGRRMSIREQMTYPFTEGWKTLKEKFARPVAVPAE